MIEAVETPKLSEMDEIKKDLGKLFFDYGRVLYELELKEKEKNAISVRLHNLNEKAKKLQEQLAKEAQKEAMKVSLAAPEAVPQ